jgi:hypothetical protein
VVRVIHVLNRAFSLAHALVISPRLAPPLVAGCPPIAMNTQVQACDVSGSPVRALQRQWAPSVNSVHRCCTGLQMKKQAGGHAGCRVVRQARPLSESAPTWELRLEP